MPAARWDGAVNAWQVSGHVYRMGRREWLTDAGWKQAFDGGIRTVIDLRNDEERRPRPTDPAVPGTTLAAFDLILAPTEDPDHGAYRDTFGPYLNTPENYADYARLFPHRLAGVIKAVAAARGGVVIHCSAGRDRSGIVAAMLQDLAGHSEESIAASYQRSMRAINEHHRRSGIPHPYERHLPDDVLQPLLERRTENLLDFIRNLNTTEYLCRHGVTGAELGAVRAKLGA